MIKKVNVFDYSETITKALTKGVLITTKLGDRVNTMTISWGMLGIEWSKPIFITFVRESRFTKEHLDATGEFTVNIPISDIDSHILSFCGSRSGRDVDKFQTLGLEQVPSQIVDAPGIRQLPLTLECKVLYRQAQDPAQIPSEVIDRYYPELAEKLPSGEPRDYHTAYYAQIVNAYIAE